MDKRVFWSVLAALVIFGVLVIGWRALERERDREDAQAVMDSITQYAQQGLADSLRQTEAESQRQLDVQQRAREVDAMNVDRRRLLPDQRCIGGTVITVKGSVYTQVLLGGTPVSCSGVYASVPLR
ncbi:MAG: hypothetical protein ABI870_14930 [Rhodanobacter sp.]